MSKEKSILWESKRLNEILDEHGPHAPHPEGLIESEFVKNYGPANAARKVAFGTTPDYKGWWAEDKTEWGTGQYKIDLSWTEEGSTIVAEVQLELNNEALGQALVYAHVYSFRNPDDNVVPAIVCCLAPKHYLEVAKKHGIRVYYCRIGHKRS